MDEPTPSIDKSQCQLYELVQYQCEVTSTHIECNPFVRVFLRSVLFPIDTRRDLTASTDRCAGKPTTEVTPEYDYNGDPVTK